METVVEAKMNFRELGKYIENMYQTQASAESLRLNCMFMFLDENKEMYIADKRSNGNHTKICSVSRFVRHVDNFGLHTLEAIIEDLDDETEEHHYKIRITSI